jgi:hypothetical protein
LKDFGTASPGLGIEDAISQTARKSLPWFQPIQMQKVVEAHGGGSKMLRGVIKYKNSIYVTN